MESRLKKARVNASELLHDAFLAKAAPSKEKQWHGLNGNEKLLFLEAVSKQWNAWQDNAPATVIPPAEVKVIWRALKKQGMQDRVMQSRLVLVDRNTKEKHSRESIRHQGIHPHGGSWIRRSRRAGHS